MEANYFQPRKLHERTKSQLNQKPILYDKMSLWEQKNFTLLHSCKIILKHGLQRELMTKN